VLDRLVPAVCLLTIVVTLGVLVGWVVGARDLIRVVSTPGAGAMMPNTATGLLLCGASLWLLGGGTRPSSRRVGQVLAVGVLLLGLVTLTEYLFSIDLGIDHLLFDDKARTLTPRTPGRPAPLTASCFALLGAALLLLHVQTRRGWHPARTIALLVAILAGQALISYVYLEEPRPDGMGRLLPHYPAAVHTALLLLLLSIGVLSVNPRRGLMGVLLRNDAGGLMARRLLPATVLLPLLVWGLRLFSERLGVRGLPFSSSAFALVTVAAFLAILARNANALSGLDALQRASEQSLRLSEARFSNIVNHAADAIITIDPAHRITLYNTAAEHVFGYTRDEAVGRELDLLLPNGLEALEVDDGVAQGLGGRRPLLGRRKDGARFPAEATVASIQVDETVQLTLIVRDVSARVRAEEELRNREALFRAAFEHAPIGLALVDPDGRFRTVNGALCDMLGYTQEELRQRTFQDITHPDDLAKDLDQVQALLRGQHDTYQLEKRYFHKRGQVITAMLTVSLIRDARGAPLYFISQIQDITERKYVEEARRLLAETGPILASSLDPETTLLTVSQLLVPSMADQCITATLDAQGRLIAQTARASSPEKSRLLEQLLREYPLVPFEPGHLPAQVIETGRPLLVPEIPASMLHELAVDERHEDLLVRLAPRSSLIVPMPARGRTVGILMLSTSESGRRYEERDLALAEEMARRAGLAIDNASLHAQSEQATHLRDEVLRIVAHDLRSPLNIIALSARSLLNRSGSRREPDDARPLASIQKAVGRATHLIEDLLDVARMQGGRLTVERRVEQTQALFREALELHRALAEAHGIQLRLELAPDTPPVYVDRERVLQLLSNLLGNALKFTPTGGRITLRAEPSSDGMRCSVSDTGSGIAADDLPPPLRALLAGPHRQGGRGPGTLHRQGNHGGPRRRGLGGESARVGEHLLLLAPPRHDGGGGRARMEPLARLSEERGAADRPASTPAAPTARTPARARRPAPARPR